MYTMMAQPDNRETGVASVNNEFVNSTESDEGGFRENVNEQPAATRNLTGRSDHESVRHRTNVRRQGESRNSRALEHIEQLEHQQQEEEESNSTFFYLISIYIYSGL